MQTQAEAAITDGASVLLVDPLDSGQRRRHRGQRRVQGRARSSTTTASPRAAPTTAYYVSFDNVKVGKLIGKGVVDCIEDVEGRRSRTSSSWTAIPTDNNAKLFAEGYNGVLEAEVRRRRRT